MEFKVGDRVNNMGGSLGEGTILVIDDRGIGVRFDNSHPACHSVHGCEDNHGYWVTESYVLSLISRAVHVCKLVCKCDARGAVRL